MSLIDGLVKTFQFIVETLSLEHFWSSLGQRLSGEQGSLYLGVTLKLVVGLILARIIHSLIIRGFARRTHPQHLMLLRRSIAYGVFSIFLFSALQDLNAGTWLLGAAGLITIAIGFASQTSVSNLISGLFLIGERAIEIGEIIEVEGTIGEVLSVDLLSTKIRTFDNLLVRVPNETMVKTKIVNITRFPIRRIDLEIGVDYQDDLKQIREILFELADNNSLALEEPRPLFLVKNFGDSAVELQFSVWTTHVNFLELKSSLLMEIKEAFEKVGINIPFPQVTFHTNGAPTSFESVRGDE